MPDQYIAWDPIPEYAKTYPGLDVQRFQVARDALGHAVITVLVCALKPESRSFRQGVDAWLITFEQIRAFRYRGIPERGVGDPPFVGPQIIEQAVWEVSPSSWAAHQYGPFPYEPMRHYVLADDGTAYEILAARWKSEQLLDDWQQQYQISF